MVLRYLSATLNHQAGTLICNRLLLWSRNDLAIGSELQREIGSKADCDWQILAAALRPLEGQAQVPAVVEPDRRTTGADKLEPMIGRVVDAGVGIADENDAGGDEAAAIGGRMVQDRKHAPKLDLIGVNAFLRRTGRYNFGRFG